ncbi:hypothetical protein [Radiobacillus deserti]|nr:hypothetical protein [Radiobacillus deserti]
MVVILRLGSVQVLNGDVFQAKIDETVHEITKIPTPRGELFDRNYQSIVENTTDFGNPNKVDRR